MNTGHKIAAAMMASSEYLKICVLRATHTLLITDFTSHRQPLPKFPLKESSDLGDLIFESN